MRKGAICFIVAISLAILGTTCAFQPKAEAIVLPWNKEHADALRVFQFLNYIDFGLSEAIQTEDALVLARQYEILAGNLDLAVIKDEQLIEVIEALGELVDRTETDRLDEQVKVVFSAKTRERIYGNLSGSEDILDSIRQQIPRLGAPWYDYRKNRDEYAAILRGKIKLTEGQLRKLTELRKEMLRVSWELFGKYQIGEEERIMEKEMDRFVAVIDEYDSDLMARQLRRLLKDQPAFEAFPPFWFYSGMAEIEAGRVHDNYGLNCFNRYHQTYRDLFKKDPLLAMTAIERLYLLHAGERVQRLKNLELMRSNCSSTDWQFYLFASILEGEMGMIPQAREDLYRNIDNGRQVSLCSAVLGRILMDSKDIRGFSDVMADFIDDDRVLPGDILMLASYCDLKECREWLNGEMAKLTLSIARSDESCIRMEIPSGWLSYPCSMDLYVSWSRDERGWNTSLSPTAIAVLPEGTVDDKNRLIETYSTPNGPELPEKLYAHIIHRLFEVSSEWKLIPPDEGIGRDLRLALGKAFPFYRPETGRYELVYYRIGDRSMRKELLERENPSEEETTAPSAPLSEKTISKDSLPDSSGDKISEDALSPDVVLSPDISGEEKVSNISGDL